RGEARRHDGVGPRRGGIRRTGGGRRDRCARRAPGEPRGAARGARVGAHAGGLPGARPECAPARSTRRWRGPREKPMRRRVALHVDVLAFDDVLAPTHEANVTLAVTLEDRAHGRLLTRTLDARAGIENDDPASMATAMGQALDDAVAQVADAVRLSLQAHRA